MRAAGTGIDPDGEAAPDAAAPAQPLAQPAPVQSTLAQSTLTMLVPPLPRAAEQPAGPARTAGNAAATQPAPPAARPAPTAPARAQSPPTAGRTGGEEAGPALPVIERLLTDGTGGRSRNPKCIVLAPTRELAKQVENEICITAPSLETACVYGGTPIGGQEGKLRRGVDIVVGTPGRVQDLMNRRSLDLGEIEFVVLDEADQMLNVGFEEDVEAGRIIQERNDYTIDEAYDFIREFHTSLEDAMILVNGEKVVNLSDFSYDI